MVYITHTHSETHTQMHTCVYTQAYRQHRNNPSLGYYHTHYLPKNITSYHTTALYGFTTCSYLKRKRSTLVLCGFSLWYTYLTQSSFQLFNLLFCSHLQYSLFFFVFSFAPSPSVLISLSLSLSHTYICIKIHTVTHCLFPESPSLTVYFHVDTTVHCTGAIESADERKGQEFLSL